MAVVYRAEQKGAGLISPLTIVLGVLLAGGQIANQLILTSPGDYQWRTWIAVFITFLASIGIQPLFGPALTNVFHVSAHALLVVGSAITAANGILSTVAMSTALHTVLAAVLTLVGALLFGAPRSVRVVPLSPPVGHVH